MHSCHFRLLALCLRLLLSLPAGAAVWQLAIQPILPRDRTLTAYAPLAEYLSRATGQTIRIRASHNFVDYWESMRQPPGFDLVLDAAHFTDYRNQRMGYRVLAKLPDTVTYSLVTGEDTLLFEPAELIGKRVATIPPPSLGGLRLNEMFPNPLRQPVVVATNNSQEALARLKAGRALAALVPTPLIRGDASVNVITTTEPVPHMALSVSPRIPASLRTKIRAALLRAGQTPRGKAMLDALKLPGFVPASNDLYQGYARLLEGTWGY